MNNRHKGFTLVETIVSASLLVVLMGVIALLTPSFANQYANARNRSQTDFIGSALLDNIESELTYASGQITIKKDQNNSNDIVTYYDQYSRQVTLSVMSDTFKVLYDVNEDNNQLDNGLLVWNYASSVLSDGSTLPSLPWGYTKDFYIDNIITDFSVVKCGMDGSDQEEFRYNVLLVHFELFNVKTNQTAEFERYVQCVNFNQNIPDNGISSD